MNLCTVMRLKLIKNSNNLFEQQFIMHPNNILCKSSVVESSYLSFNNKNI
jgi:hypothetical protein